MVHAQSLNIEPFKAHNGPIYGLGTYAGARRDRTAASSDRNGLLTYLGLILVDTLNCWI